MSHDYPCRLPRILTDGQPTARALLRGGSAHPDLWGEVLFYPFQEGSLLLVRAIGLPGEGFFALRIHTSGDCREGGDLPFYCAGAPFDPEQTPRVDHTGDLPALLSSGGRAYTVIYTGRFRPDEVSGRSALLHIGSGGRIACGIIERMDWSDAPAQRPV